MNGSNLTRAEFQSELWKIMKNIPGLPGVDASKTQSIIKASIKENLNDMYWPAFTHVTFSVSYKDNYEKLEKLGDKYMNAAIQEYIANVIPNGTPMLYTELLAYYGSNEIAAKFGLKLGFENLIRVEEIEPDDTEIVADVFEAFCAAIFQSFNLVIPGAGYVFLYNMIIYLFEICKIDIATETAMYGSAKTQINEIMSQVKGAGKLVARSSNGGRNEIFLTGAQAKAINQVTGWKMPEVDKVIGSGVRSSKGESDAWKEALDYFIKYGFTSETVTNLRHSKDLRLPELRDYMPALFDKLQDEGFKNFDFINPNKLNKEKDAMIIILIGIRADGEQERLSVARVLAKGSNTNTKTMGKVEAVMKYLGITAKKELADKPVRQRRTVVAATKTTIVPETRRRQDTRKEYVPGEREATSNVRVVRRRDNTETRTRDTDRKESPEARRSTRDTSPTRRSTRDTSPTRRSTRDTDRKESPEARKSTRDTDRKEAPVRRPIAVRRTIVEE